MCHFEVVAYRCGHQVREPRDCMRVHTCTTLEPDRHVTSTILCEDCEEIRLDDACRKSVSIAGTKSSKTKPSPKKDGR